MDYKVPESHPCSMSPYVAIDDAGMTTGTPNREPEWEACWPAKPQNTLLPPHLFLPYNLTMLIFFSLSQYRWSQTHPQRYRRFLPVFPNIAGKDPALDDRIVKKTMIVTLLQAQTQASGTTQEDQKSWK